MEKKKFLSAVAATAILVFSPVNAESLQDSGKRDEDCTSNLPEEYRRAFNQLSLAALPIHPPSLCRFTCVIGEKEVQCKTGESLFDWNFTVINSVTPHAVLRRVRRGCSLLFVFEEEENGGHSIFGECEN